MKKIILVIIFIIASNNLLSQILIGNLDNKHTLSLKTGWEQIIATGLNYSFNVDTMLIAKPTNIQIEFLSPIATFHKFYNGRIFVGMQTEFYKKRHFKLIANLFGTYSWTEDITTKIKGIGIYTSIIPAYYTEKNWIFGFELAYRPTLLAYFNFSETADETFNDRYPSTRGNDEVPDRDGWYSFTNNRFQLALLVNKNFKEKYYVGLKLGFEHFINENNILLNGWIGQIPLNGNINFGYNF